MKDSSVWRRRLGKLISSLVILLLATSGALAFGASKWSLREFGPISVPQALDNLSGSGNEGIPDYYAASLAKWIVFPGVVVFVGACVALLLSRWLGKHHHIFWSRFILALTLIGSLVSATIGAVYADKAINLVKWLTPRPTHVDIAEYYVEPDVVKPTDGDKNLVVIYLESMDTAFADDSLVEGNALESLLETTEDWATLDRYTQYPSGGWSQAGMVASYCGIPIRAEGEDSVANGSEIAVDTGSYMPGVTCLSDILHQEGYNQVFLSGGDLTFANSRNFLTSHGFDRVLELRDWEAQGETEMVSWGLADRRLIHYVKQELLDLSKQNAPFSLSFATLDNHSPASILPHCPDAYSDKTLSAIKCQSEMVAELVDFMDENGLLENTVVVMIADHQIMDGYPVAAYRNLIPRQDEYPIFNKFYSPDGVTLQRSEGTQLDVFPTLYNLLGGELSDGRGGLGVSLLVPEESATQGQMLPSLSRDEQYEVLTSKSSDWIRQIWGETD